MKKLLFTLIVSFALSGTIFAQTYSTHWPDFDYHQYADNKGLVAYVSVEGQFADADNYQRYEVAAFVGDNCRGVSFLKDETSLNDAYPAFQMQVYYDAQEGQEEQLSFKLYDHVAGVEYSSCTPKFFSTSEATTLYTDNWYLGVWGEPNSNQAIVLDFASAETQTIALANGTNWFSTYLDITLEDLQAALVAASSPNKTITIKSPSVNSVYSRGRWNTPASFVWDVTSMYYIIVSENCEIVLEGTPIDPAAHTITIAGGGVATWIGYPFSEEMSVTAAFAALPPTINDKVKNSATTASYTRGRWNGEFNLAPGFGYIYISAPNASDREFTYPSGSSKSAQRSVNSPLKLNKVSAKGARYND